MNNTPILKSHWERYKAHVSLDVATAQQLIAPYSTETISDIQWLSEGCANTNYKITFTRSSLSLNSPGFSLFIDTFLNNRRR